MIVLQLLTFFLIFIVLVRVAIIGGAKNALYFYPKAYQKIAVERGIADKETIKKRKIIFMIPFCLILAVSLVLILGFWVKPTSFLYTYLYALLFLEVMNWLDGLLIDKLWVGTDKVWRIKGMEDVPYVQTWKQVFIKRGILSTVWLVGAVIVAGIVVLIFHY